VLIAWIVYVTWPRRLSYAPELPLPRPDLHGGQLVLKSPTGYLFAEVGHYHDELSAYLDFEYLRSLPWVDDSRVLLTASEIPGGPAYRIYFELENDLLAAIPYLARLQAGRWIGRFHVDYGNRSELLYFREQTHLFSAAYNEPIRRKLESIPRTQLTANVAQFLLFKAKTDRRVRERIEPVPPQLSGEQAHEMAADIIAVANFYSLPLELFLGIGAMENNFLNVMGDMEHTVWKRRAAPGDLVVGRRRGRVLVWNYSLGVWQITRETLRYAQELYLKDKRDYSKLPERLRPSGELDVNAIGSHVLTTYAGLLLRDLLDRFGGDVEKAAGAYNGGPSNPNAQYASGVEQVANYARRVLSQSAMVNGRAIAETKIIISARRRRASMREQMPLR